MEGCRESKNCCWLGGGRGHGPDGKKDGEGVKEADEGKSRDGWGHSCSNAADSGGLLRAAGPTAPPARASLQHPVRAIHRDGQSLKTPGRCRGAWAEQTDRQRHTDPRPLEPGKRPVPRSPAQSCPPPHQLRPLAADPCRAASCSPAQAMHVLVAVPPAANRNAPATLQRRAASSLLLHQLSPAFNSSQSLDPKSNAISQAAAVPRVAGGAADANKVLFSFPFMPEPVSPPTDHILNLLVH